MKLLSSFILGNLKLKNRVVMAPMTRSRAINNIPNQLMAEYYTQRSNAGLIITEGTAPSVNGLGYPRIPGIYSAAQIEGWRLVTDAVHASDGKIFIQLMHTGRISHPYNMASDAVVIAPSAIQASGEIYTDQSGLQPHPIPDEMTKLQIEQTKQEFVRAAINSMEAGFDGVEIHAANGYLIEQFINPGSNQRNDNYGGSIQNRCRFVIEVAAMISKAIGAERVGIRISPYGVYNDMSLYEDIDETYEFLALEMAKLKLSYIHIVDHSSQGAPEVPDSIKRKIKATFRGNIIASGGMSKTKAEQTLQSGNAELVSFGTAYLANPDLVLRLSNDLELNSPDYDTFFTPGEKGYVDYPFAN
jgi:N-ethylmaleimide reductase